MKDLRAYLKIRTGLKNNTSTWEDITQTIFLHLPRQEYPDVTSMAVDNSNWETYLGFLLWVASHAKSVFSCGDLAVNHARDMMSLFFRLVAERQDAPSVDWENQFLQQHGVRFFTLLNQLKVKYKDHSQVKRFYDILDFHYLVVMIDYGSSQSLPVMVLLDCVINHNSFEASLHYSNMIFRSQSSTARSGGANANRYSLLPRVYQQLNEIESLRRLRLVALTAQFNVQQNNFYEDTTSMHRVFFQSLDVIMFVLIAFDKKRDTFTDNLPYQRYELGDIVELKECCQFVVSYFKQFEQVELLNLCLALNQWFLRHVYQVGYDSQTDNARLGDGVGLRLMDLYCCIVSELPLATWCSLKTNFMFKQQVDSVLSGLMKTWNDGFLISRQSVAAWLVSVERLSATRSAVQHRAFLCALIDVFIQRGNTYLLDAITQATLSQGFFLALQWRLFQSSSTELIRVCVDASLSTSGSAFEIRFPPLTCLVATLVLSFCKSKRLLNQSHMDVLGFDDALKYFNPLLQWCMQFSLGMNTLRSIRSVLEPLLLKLMLPNGVTGQSMSVAERLFIELRVSPVIRSFLFPKELDGEAFERYIDGSDLPAVRSQTRLSIGI